MFFPFLYIPEIHLLNPGVGNDIWMYVADPPSAPRRVQALAGRDDETVCGWDNVASGQKPQMYSAVCVRALCLDNGQTSFIARNVGLSSFAFE